MKSPGNNRGILALLRAGGWRGIANRMRSATQRHQASVLAGGVAFFAFLSMFPALAALVSVYGLVAESRGRDAAAGRLCRRTAARHPDGDPRPDGAAHRALDRHPEPGGGDRHPGRDLGGDQRNEGAHHRAQPGVRSEGDEGVHPAERHCVPLHDGRHRLGRHLDRVGDRLSHRSFVLPDVAARGAADPLGPLADADGDGPPRLERGVPLRAGARAGPPGAGCRLARWRRRPSGWRGRRCSPGSRRPTPRPTGSTVRWGSSSRSSPGSCCRRTS